MTYLMKYLVKKYHWLDTDSVPFLNYDIGNLEIKVKLISFVDKSTSQDATNEDTNVYFEIFSESSSDFIAVLGEKSEYGNYSVVSAEYFGEGVFQSMITNLKVGLISIGILVETKTATGETNIGIFATRKTNAFFSKSESDSMGFGDLRFMAIITDHGKCSISQVYLNNYYLKEPVHFD